jgi:hypothetical protein
MERISVCETCGLAPTPAADVAAVLAAVVQQLALLQVQIGAMKTVFDEEAARQRAMAGPTPRGVF